MSHIFTKFRIFESQIYNRLDEIRFSDHWKERTAVGGSDWIGFSRVLPHTPNTPYGFSIEYATDSAGNQYALEDVLKELGDPSRVEITKLVSKALYKMSRGVELQKWEPKPDNKYLYILDLGRIVLTDGIKKFYLHLAAGNPQGEDKDGKWVTGDSVWGFADKRKKGLMAITLKYYTSTPEGLNMAKEASRRDANMSLSDFYASSRIEYPYGKGFELLLDLSDPSPKGREDKINAQLAGEEILLGPSGKGHVPITEETIVRKTITPGDKVGLVVKYADPENPIMGTITAILNMKEIEDAQKIKSLGDIKEIKVAFLPEDKKHIKTGSDGNPLQIPLKLVDGSKMIIDDVTYIILGEDGNKPLITSEPSIINKGSVQTWVKKV
jgi:hypothetical protein